MSAKGRFINNDSSAFMPPESSLYKLELAAQNCHSTFYIESLRWMRATTGFDNKIDMN